MMNTLLFIHLTLAVLLIAVILLQKTGADGLSGIGGGGNNTGIISSRGVANFFTRTTIILSTAFFINAIILANLSSKKHIDISQKFEKIEEQGTDKPAKDNDSLPVAK